MKVYGLHADFDIAPDGGCASYGGLCFTQAKAFTAAKEALRDEEHRNGGYTKNVTVSVCQVDLTKGGVQWALRALQDGAGLPGDDIAVFSGKACGKCERCKEVEPGWHPLCTNPIVKQEPPKETP